eukprot:tig00000249_g22160.t1
MACFSGAVEAGERVEAIGYLQDAAANALKRRKTGRAVQRQIPENIVAQVAHVATPIDPKTGQPIPLFSVPPAWRKRPSASASGSGRKAIRKHSEMQTVTVEKAYGA